MSKAFLALFGALLLVSIGLLTYPMAVIQPFRRQGETELKAALWIIRWRPYFEAAAAAGAIAAAAWYWQRQPRKWPRILTAFAVLVICAAAALSRVNVYEMMFHRYDRPSFSPAAESKVEADDKVLAIVLGGQARAYPIRTMAYHHVVNDELGGIPLVATY